MHPDEGKLLALVDGEVDPAETEALEGHLAACPECASRRAEIEALADRVRRAFDADPTGPVPATTADDVVAIARRRSTLPANRSRPLLKAASVAALVVTAAAALALPGSPLRRAITGPERERATAEEPAPGAAADGSAVALAPAERLVVAFAAGQERGTIEIVLGPSPTARVESSDPSVAFSVGSDSIGVQNAGADASYVITVPEPLASVVVTVAGAPVFRKAGVRIDGVSPLRDGRAVVDFRSIP